MSVKQRPKIKGLWVEDKLSPHIYRANSRMLYRNDRLLQVGLSMLPKNLCHVLDLGTDQKAVFMLVFVKCNKTFRAMNLLAGKGFGSDAIILLRTLVELQIVLKFINSGDVAHRAKQFYDFSTVVTSYKLSRHFQLNKEAMDELDAAVERLKTNHGKQWWQDAVQRSKWSSYSLRGMAAEARLADLYDVIYAHACEASHGTDLVSHVRVIDGMDYAPEFTVSTDWVDHVLRIGNFIYADTLLELDNFFTAGKAAAITEERVQNPLRLLRN